MLRVQYELEINLKVFCCKCILNHKKALHKVHKACKYHQMELKYQVT